MRDKMGLELLVGDTVVTTYRGYSDLVPGEVVGFTPRKVKIQIDPRQNPDPITKFSEQVAVVVRDLR